MNTQMGVWIDHRKAIVVAVTDQGEETGLVISHVERQLRRAGDSPLKGSFETRRVPADDTRQRAFTGHLNIYYDAVIACVRGAESILIFGPGEAKRELKVRLEKNKLGGRIAAIKTADKMTHRQIVAKVRGYFDETADGNDDRRDLLPLTNNLRHGWACREARLRTTEVHTMTTIHEFSERLDSEFGLMSAANDERRAILERAYHERQARVAKLFIPVLARLRGIWEPRRDALLARFKDKIHIIPAANDDISTARFSLDSPLARITLKFMFSHDPEVRNLVLEYRLDVVPILMKIDNHATLELKLENFDQDVAALWLEDQMISFIRTFVELNGNQYYLNDHMVEDVIACVRMPRSVAKESVDWDGHKYYFICADTRREFEKQHGCVSDTDSRMGIGQLAR